MFFIDESGSIPKHYDPRYKYRYFVISFVHTNNPRKLENTYKRSIRKLKKEFPAFFSKLQNPKEPKASELLPFMKLFIIEKLFQSTDIKLAHMVVDNWNIEQRFREMPARSFNFLVKLILDNFPLTSQDKDHLQLKIDNRNTAIHSLKELEGYLYTEMVLKEQTVKKVSVEYLDSKKNINIQVADLFANTFYQRFRYKTINFPKYQSIKGYIDLVHPYTMEYIYTFIKQSNRLYMPFMYPPSLRKEVAASAEL
jgi:hypothetical protein